MPPFSSGAAMLDRIRRVVTGNNEQGLSTVVLDGRPQNELQAGGAGVLEIWRTDGGQVDSTDRRDPAQPPFALLPPLGGNRILFFKVAPEESSLTAEQQERRAAAAFAAYMAEDARPDTRLSPWMHKTSTIDYVIVLAGEVSLKLDDGETALKPFDVVVQRGTNHAWVNHGSEPCLMAAILNDAKFD